MTWLWIARARDDEVYVAEPGRPMAAISNEVSGTTTLYDVLAKAGGQTKP